MTIRRSDGTLTEHFYYFTEKQLLLYRYSIRLIISSYITCLAPSFHMADFDDMDFCCSIKGVRTAFASTVLCDIKPLPGHFLKYLKLAGAFTFYHATLFVRTKL